MAQLVITYDVMTRTKPQPDFLYAQFQLSSSEFRLKIKLKPSGKEIKNGLYLIYPINNVPRKKTLIRQFDVITMKNNGHIKEQKNASYFNANATHEIIILTSRSQTSLQKKSE